MKGGQISDQLGGGKSNSRRKLHTAGHGYMTEVSVCRKDWVREPR